MIHSIPTLTLAGILAVLVIAYFVSTTRLVKRKPRCFWIPALCLALVGIGFYSVEYYRVGVSNVLSNLALSITAGLDLFLFKMNTTYGRFTDLFYLLPDSSGHPIPDPAVQNRLMLICAIYLCAIWTTFILIIHFVSRRIGSRGALAWQTWRHPSRSICLFFGTGPEALALARSLDKKLNLVFIDLPVREPFPNTVSLIQIFQHLRTNVDSSIVLRDEFPDALVLKAKKPLYKCNGKNLFKELGLPRLQKWASHPQSRLFLLSRQYDDNLSAVQKLTALPGQIYCHAPREGLALRIELSTPGDHIHMVDESALVNKVLKTREDLYPVHMMDIARNDKGEPLGYVKGSFNALICGFGKEGQGAFSFLYEYGVFPQKNHTPNEFHCAIIDAQMDQLEGAFRVNHPGLEADRVSYHKEVPGSEAFWKELVERIESLNYVFIAHGNDSENIQLALDVLEFAFRTRSSLDHFLILVKLDHPAVHKKLIDYFNENFGGKKVLKTIGEISALWAWNTISGEAYQSSARRFYTSYATASGDSTTWEERRSRILGRTGVSDMARKLELQRKEGEDFGNYYHTRVKACLCPSWLWEYPQISQQILPQAEGKKHFGGDDSQAEKLLEYMAVGEHLRWNASHQANGYRYGQQKQEDLKTHPQIVSYDKLDETVKHYDWIVIKTALELLRNQSGK